MIQFDNLQAFIAMGGHGVFVWSVYAITLAVLVLLTLAPLQKSRRFFIRQAMLLKRQQGQNPGNGDSSQPLNQ